MERIQVSRVRNSLNSKIEVNVINILQKMMFIVLQGETFWEEGLFFIRKHETNNYIKVKFFEIFWWFWKQKIKSQC